MADVDASGSSSFFCVMKIGNGNLDLPKKNCCKISPLCLSMYRSILWVVWCTVFMQKRLGETSCKHRSPFPAWVLSNLARYERPFLKVFRVFRSLSLLFVERVCRDKLKLVLQKVGHQ
jgi:hypothetical protein